MIKKAAFPLCFLRTYKNVFSLELGDEIKDILRSIGAYETADTGLDKERTLRDRTVWAVCIVIHDQHPGLVLNGRHLYKPIPYEKFNHLRLYNWGFKDCFNNSQAWNALKIGWFLKMVSEAS